MEANKIIKEIQDRLDHQELRAARQLLRKLLTQGRLNASMRQKAGQFYLRMPDPLKAFQVLERATSRQPELQLTLANAANFLGASQYALRILNSIPESIKEIQLVEVGQILSTTYRDVEALKYFINAGSAHCPRPASTTVGEQTLLLRCYPLLELQRNDEVLAICDYMFAHKVPIWRRAFAHVFAAWAQLQCDELQAAEKHLEDFFVETSHLEKNWADSLAHLVLTMLHIKRRDFTKARTYLDLAWKTSFRPGLQPEAMWLTLAYLQGEICFLQDGRLPIAWARMLAYPTVTETFREKISSHLCGPQSAVVTVRGFAQKSAKMHFDATNEAETLQSKSMHRVDKSQYLLMLLTVAGPFGIPMFRLFDVLWPEEPLSLSSHRKRLEQLVHRLRQAGFVVRWHGNHLWGMNLPVSVEVSTQASKPPRIPFEENFSRKDVAKHFHVSERTAKRICAQWIREGYIKKEGAGPRTAYLAK